MTRFWHGTYAQDCSVPRARRVTVMSGNCLDGTVTGNEGIVSRKHHGFCLEAQHFPDSIHHASFPSVVLEPGPTYTQTTVYRFLAR